MIKVSVDREKFLKSKGRIAKKINNEKLSLEEKLNIINGIYKKYKSHNNKNAMFYNDWGYQIAKNSCDKNNMNNIKEKFKRATEIDPNNPLIYANWGDVFLKQCKNNKKAIEKFEYAEKLGINIAWVYANFGVALSNQKEYQKAIEKSRKALTIDRESWVGDAMNNLNSSIDNMGKNLVNSRQYNKAIEEYQEVIDELKKHDESIITYWSNIRITYALTQVGKAKKALSECKNILKKLKENRKIKEYMAKKAAVNAICGLASLQEEDYKNAKRYCKKAINDNTNQKGDWAYICKGKYEFKMGEFKENKRANKKAKEHYKQAKIFYKKAVEIKEENPDYHYELGLTYFKLGDYEKAIEEYKKATSFFEGGDRDWEIASDAEKGIEEIHGL